MRRTSARPRAALRAVALAAASAVAVAGVLAPTATASASPSSDAGRAGGPRDVVTRQVSFDLVNASDSVLLGCGDSREHRVRATLVGPRRAVDGTDPTVRVNVLVHDAGTGAWFWDLPGHPRQSYARALARRGETSLVLSRLGYDRSRLRDGDDTCLGAQTSMLHQVVQHLMVGQYEPVHGSGSVPIATQVALHGHGTGAALAQIESAVYDDVAGLVLTSVLTAASSDLATTILAEQTTACLGSRTFAPFGTAREFRSVLFASAPAGVRRDATRLRNPTPCGDVGSTASAVAVSRRNAGRIDQPVLVLSGGRDRRGAVLGKRAVRERFDGSRDARALVLGGAGSAVPIERTGVSAKRVVPFLRGLRGVG